MPIIIASSTNFAQALLMKVWKTIRERAIITKHNIWLLINLLANIRAVSLSLLESRFLVCTVEWSFQIRAGHCTTRTLCCCLRPSSHWSTLRAQENGKCTKWPNVWLLEWKPLKRSMNQFGRGVCQYMLHDHSSLSICKGTYRTVALRVASVEKYSDLVGVSK